MSEKLTGNTRYRAHKPLFRRPRLVLQVEVSQYADDHGAIVRCTWWRDARVEDLPCAAS